MHGQTKRDTEIFIPESCCIVNHPFPQRNQVRCSEVMYLSLTYQQRLTDSKQSLASIDHIDLMLTSLTFSDLLRVLV